MRTTQYEKPKKPPEETKPFRTPRRTNSFRDPERTGKKKNTLKLHPGKALVDLASPLCAYSLPN
jgi:hypothetical protein